jgi:hypothetical protein
LILAAVGGSVAAMHATIVASDPRRPRLILAIEGTSDEVWDAVWRARSVYRRVEWTIGYRPASAAADVLPGSNPRPEWLRDLMARQTPGVDALVRQVDLAVEERRRAAPRRKAAAS